MEEKYKIGDFGLFDFYKRTHGELHWYQVYATIMDKDKSRLWLVGNNDETFNVRKENIKNYIKLTKTENYVE